MAAPDGPAGAPTAPTAPTAPPRWGWLVLLAVLTAVAVAVQLASERASYAVAGTDRLRDAARYLEEQVTQQFEGANAALDGIRSAYLAARVQPGVAGNDQLRTLTQAIPVFSSLAVHDANGVAVLADDDAATGTSAYDEAAVAAVRARPDPGLLYVVLPDVHDGPPPPLYLAKALVAPDGRWLGAVVARLDAGYLGLVGQSARYLPDVRVSLSHGSGRLYVTVPDLPRQGAPNVAAPGSLLDRHLQSGLQRNLFEGPVQRGEVREQRLVAFANIEARGVRSDQPLVLSMSRSRDALYASWRTNALRTAGVLAALVALAVLGRWLALRRGRAMRLLAARSRAELAASAQRLERALAGADLGLWEFHPAADVLTVDARGCAVLGLGPADAPRTGKAWTERLHPDDRAANAAAFAAHLQGRSDAYESRFRVRRGDGSYRWLLSRAKLVQGDADTPAFMLGTFFDITEQRYNEERLAQALLLQARSGRLAKVGGWLFDVETGRGSWTDETFRIHGMEPAEEPPAVEEALGHHPPESRAVMEQAIAHSIATGEPYDVEVELVTPAGQARWIRAQGEPAFENGKVVRMAGAVQDITERKLAALALEGANAELAALSLTDALTGLGNRRQFDRALHTEWARAARSGASVAVLLLDVDFFKRYNDLHGHPAGDACLRRVAEITAGTVGRSGDSAMRYGGEEFAVLLADTDAAGAMVVAQRVVDAVASRCIPHGDSPVASWVTVSVGVAAAQASHQRPPAALLADADAALYRAKHGGRDRASL